MNNVVKYNENINKKYKRRKQEQDIHCKAFDGRGGHRLTFCGHSARSLLFRIPAFLIFPERNMSTLTAGQRAALAPPSRDKFGQGSRGKPVKLIANFLQMRFQPNNQVALYDVTIKPEGKPPVVNRKVFDKFMEMVSSEAGTPVRAVYDGRKLSFAIQHLPVDKEYTVSFVVSYNLFIYVDYSGKSTA